MNKRLAFRILPLLSAAIVLAVSSCHKPEETVTAREAVLSVPEPELGNRASRQFVTVEADGPWTLEIDFGEAEPWARVEPASGEGDRSDIVLSWDANDGNSRGCTIVLHNGGRSSDVELRQRPAPGYDSGPEELRPDTPGKWLELPATDDDPLNAGLIGGSGLRSDKWGLDPKVPARYQPILSGGYRGGYQRGHQIASADRQHWDDNVATFYYTNMTPQLGSLNGYAWAVLEGMVRDWSRSVDTLYVVTGADIRGATDVAYDNEDAECTVPTGYFKALLAYKKGGAAGNATGGYVGIAFYFEHRSYSSDKSAVMGQSMTIDELEDRLGYDFFVNLPEKIGEDVAARVESEVDDWWN